MDNLAASWHKGKFLFLKGLYEFTMQSIGCVYVVVCSLIIKQFESLYFYRQYAQ